MQDDNPPGEHEAVEGPANARTPARPQLKQPVSESSRVRQTKAWPMLGKELDQARIVSKNIYRPRLDLRTNAFVEVLDLERHADMLARVLTTRKRRML